MKMVKLLVVVKAKDDSNVKSKEDDIVKRFVRVIS